MRPLGPGREISPGTKILAHLARSNGLDVYDAWNEPRACRVIVKTPRPDKLRKAGAVRHLMNEGRLLRRLTHPHIVRAYEVHSAPRPVVVMETLAGETVDHLADEGRALSGVELAHLGSHVASALVHLHGEGILHLDLKPSNVIAERGRAKLIDLSHARRAGRRRPGHGTWCYMAPEQARGGLIGPAADIWGLGIMLYSAALNVNALADMADDLDIDEPQMHARLPLLRKERPRLPRELSELVDACLEPDPAARPTLPATTQALYALADG